LQKRNKNNSKKEPNMENEKIKAQQWRGKTFMHLEMEKLFHDTHTYTQKM